MADPMLRALVEFLDRRGFKGTEDHKLQVTLVLTNGLVLSGAMVSMQRFAELNSEDNGGTCPRDFKFDDPFPNDYVHLTNVHILSGDEWARIGTLRVPVDSVLCCGDIHRPGEPPPPE